jgi:hypothetical protein
MNTDKTKAISWDPAIGNFFFCFPLFGFSDISVYLCSSVVSFLAANEIG